MGKIMNYKNKIIKGEQGSVTVFVLTVMLFFTVIGFVSYAQIFNKISMQEKSINQIKSDYEQKSNGETIEEEYRNTLDNMNIQVKIVLYKMSGELYSVDEWTNQDIKLRIFYSNEIPEEVRYFYKDGKRIEYQEDYLITDNCEIEVRYGNISDKVKITRIDKESPVIAVKPSSSTAVKNKAITIKVTDTKSGLSNENVYEYQLSTSNNQIPTGKWNVYTNDVPVDMGTDLTGDYYLWVKEVKDNVGNISIHEGNKIETYHVFGKYVFDNTQPTVEITANKTSPTNEAIVTYTIKFNEKVEGFDQGDITVENGKITKFTKVDDKQWTIEVTNDGSCEQSVEIKAGVCTDIAGNENEASNKFKMTVDKIAPKAIITGQSMISTNGLIRYFDGTNNIGNGHSDTATTWKDLSGHQDGTVNGATFNENGYANFNGTSNWVNLGQVKDKNFMSLEATVSINSIQSNDVYILGNCESGGGMIYLLEGKPRVGFYINGAYKYVNFDEVLDINRVYTISATYDGKEIKLYIDGVLHVTVQVSGTIENPKNNTVMAVGVNPNGDKATGGYSAINVYSARVYERALTQAEIQQNMNADRIKPEEMYTNNENVKLSIIFNEPVKDFTIDDMTITGATKGTLNKVTDSEYTLDISIAGSTHAVATIKDGSYTDMAGNVGSGHTINRYRDVSGPNPTITATPNANPTNANSITYNIKYHEETTGFTAEDIIVENGTKGTFKRISSKEFSIVVTNDGSCQQTISVGKGACYDQSGNPSVAKSNEVTIDRTAPTVKITANKTSPTNASSITYTIDFSEKVKDFAQGDITVTNGEITKFTQVNEQKWTIDVSNNGDYEQIVEIKEGVCTDSVGNKNEAGSLKIVIDHTAPIPIITGQASVVTSGLLRYVDGTNNLGNGHSDTATTWKDLSGHQDGIVNGATFNSNGYANFNGTSNWVNLGVIKDKNLVTLEATVKINADNMTGDIMVNYESGGMGLSISAGKPRFQVYVAGQGYKSAYLNETLYTNRIYTISGTYDGKDIRLYIDGIEHAKTTVSTTTAIGIGNPGNNTVMAIGVNPAGNDAHDGYGNIKVYSARVYERALTQAEIQQNMNADRIRTEDIPANHANVKLSFIFNEDVKDFTTDDVTVTGATKGTFTQVTNSQYTLDISIAGSTHAVATIKDGSYTDMAGNAGTSYTVKRYRDVTGPRPTITATPADNPTNASSITYKIQFHEETNTGFTTEDITVENGKKGTFTRLSSYEFTLVVTNDGSCSQKISIPAGACYDMSGNASTAGSKTVTIDRTAPTVEITANKTSPTNASSVIYTINFNENIKDFAQEDVTVENGKITAFEKKSDKQWTVTVSNDGTCTQKISVAAEVCTDNVGNNNTASSTFTMIVDRTNPTIKVDEKATAAKSQTATITIGDADTGLAAGTYTVKYQWTSSTAVPEDWSTASSISITAAKGDKTKTGTVTKGDGTGTFYLHVQGQSLKDVAGNTLNPTAYGKFVFDNTKPTPIITGQTSVVTSGLLRYVDGTNNLGNGHTNSGTTWKDLSGNENGTVTGATFNNSGYVNFDGNDWVNLGVIKDKSYMSLEATIQLNTVHSGKILCNQENGGGTIELASGKPQVGFYVNGAYKYATLNEVLDVGRIYTISGTYDGNYIKLYVDGIEHASTTISTSTKVPIGNPANNTVMAIGVNPGGSKPADTYANIKVYAARVYDRALTKAEIQQNMNADRLKPDEISSNHASVKLSFIFNEDVKDFTTDDVTVTGATKGTFTQVTNSQYTLDISIAGSTSAVATIKDGSYTDMAGNAGTSYTVKRYRDVTGPGPTITATPTANPTNASSITYKIKFHEATTGFATGDITVENGTKGTFTRVSSSEFTLVVTNDGSCSQKISVPASACYDKNGNASTAGSKTVTIDRIAPTVKITANVSTPTNASSVIYTIDFSENVKDFAQEDVTVTSGKITAFEKKSDKQWVVTVSNEGNCTQKVSVAEGVCTDPAGNNNTASNTFTMTIDRTAPQVIITGQATEVKDGLIRHLDGVNNVGNAHTNSGTTWKDLTGHQNGTLSNVTFNANGYATFNGTNSWVNLGQIENKNVITLEITLGLNSIQSGDRTLLANYESGGVGLFLNNGKPVMEAYINGSYKQAALNEALYTGRVYTITGTYDGNYVRLYIDGIEQAKTTISTTTKTPIGNPNNNTVLAVGANPNGDKATGGYSAINVYAVRVYERALTQAEIQQNMNADRIRSTSISSNHASTTLSFIFNEPVKNFTTDDITVTNGTKGTFTKVSDSEYTLNITNIPGSTTLTVKVNASGYTDNAGNAGPAATINRYRDVSGPSPTITATPTDNPTNASSITYNIKFHESTNTGFTAGDITVENGTKGAFTRVSSQEFTLVVTNDGTCSQKISILAGACYDMNGNASVAGSKTVTIDRTNPTIKVDNNTTVAKSQKATITIGDADTGLAAGTYPVKYQWTSSTQTPSDWSEASSISIIAAKGDKTKTGTVTKSDGTGTFYLHVQGQSLKDVAGNTLSPTAYGQFAIDAVGPTVKITANETSPTYETSVIYTITFNENVKDFVQTDVTVTNGEITAFEKKSDKQWTVTVSNTSACTQKIEVKAGVCTDSLGNLNTAGSMSMEIKDDGINKAYGKIDIIWVDKNNQRIASPLAPIMSTGMKKVYWEDNGTEVKEGSSGWTESKWYNYVAGDNRIDGKGSKWANAINTVNGVDSYFVWIPRYAYRITYYESEASTIITGYCDGDGERTAKGRIKQKPKEGIQTVTYNGYKYIVHPAFENNVNMGGWSNDLSGIWVGKYESARSTATATSAGSGTTAAIQIAPTVKSWVNIKIGDCYDKAKSYDTTKESHLMKNSEWGAVAYLTYSQYGRNGKEVDVNRCSSYVTGMGSGDSTYSYSSATSEQKYGGEKGQLASSTGNIYGVYDLSGGAFEYVAAFNNAGSSLSYGSTFAGTDGNSKESTKYATKYTSDSETPTYGKYYPGDATFEVYTGSGSNGWNKDSSYFAFPTCPFFIRGGYYSSGTLAGVFCADYNVGSGNGYYSFRVVLPSEEDKIDKSYGKIDVIWVDKNNQRIASPLAPVMSTGMKKVYWEDNGTEVKQGSSSWTESKWYNYVAGDNKTDSKGSKWANAINTVNGVDSYFVWIPRYAYRITYYSDAACTKVSGYCDGDGTKSVLGNIKEKPKEGIQTVTYNGYKYIVHPAFENNINMGGWSNDLSGIWVGKYESARSTATATSAGSETTAAIQIAPTVKSWVSIKIGDCYDKAKSYDTTKDSHLMKNSEWGAVAYLTYSQYGRNGKEVDINRCSSYVTGMGSGDSTSTYSYSADLAAQMYNGEKGQLASSTGNIYGVYDLSGGAYEYVAAFNNAGNSLSYGSTFAGTDGNSNDSTRYATKYTSDSKTPTYGKFYPGDATFEVYTGSNSWAWNGDYSSFAYPNVPFFDRGGSCDNGTSSGVFYAGARVGSNNDEGTFRVALPGD